MIGVLLVAALAALAALVTSIAPRHTQPSGVEIINDALPQTQCGRCGYPACRPYAEAVFRGEAAIDQCPPGGGATLKTLARLTGTALAAAPEKHRAPAQLACIDEALCIGCLKCLKVCPTDAIIGAAGQMHTVLDSECTGCALCLAPCPMDCIIMRLTERAA